MIHILTVLIWVLFSSQTVISNDYLEVKLHVSQDLEVVAEFIIAPFDRGSRGMLSYSHDFCYKFMRYLSNSSLISHSFDLRLGFVDACLDTILMKSGDPDQFLLTGEPSDSSVVRYSNLVAFWPASPYTTKLLSHVPHLSYGASIETDDHYSDADTERPSAQPFDRSRFQCTLVQESIFVRVLDRLFLHPPGSMGLVSDTHQGGTGTGTVSEAATPRVLCVIVAFAGSHRAVQAVVETWGARCAGFLAFSNYKDPRIPTVSIPYRNVMAESKTILWRKMRDIYAYVAHWYLDEFDFVLFAHADSYIVLPNLLHYLRTDPFVRHVLARSEGLYAGRPMRLSSFGNKPEFNTFYNAGGGYLLDTAIALPKLVKLLGQSDQDTAGSCGADWVDDTYDDIHLANCLKLLDIRPIDTRNVTSGAHRFHHHSPAMIEWYNGTAATGGNFYALHSYKFIMGPDGLASDSVQFHELKNWIDIYSIDITLHDCR